MPGTELRLSKIYLFIRLLGRLTTKKCVPEQRCSIRFAIMFIFTVKKGS